jgi:LEA14-like dessication related protein
MKKVPVGIIGCIAVLVLTNCQSIGSALKEPVLSLQSVDLTKISFTGAELLCKVNVENPNVFDIPLPEVGWEFFVGTNSFAKGVIKSNESIKSRKTTAVNIPVSVGYVEIFDTFVSLRGSKTVDYKVVLDAKIPLPLLEGKTWHFEKEGNFPVLQVPTVNFRSIDVKNKSLTKLDFEISLEIANNNSVAMSINNLSYNLLVNNSQWSNGSVQSAPRLAAGEKTIVPISFSMSSLNIIMNIIQIINGNADVSYAFTGDLKFGVDLPALADLGTSFNVSGTTKLR